MIRRAITAIKWLGTGIGAFVVVVYLIAVAINWQDREASATAKHLDSLYRDRPAISDRDNAFVYVMGFDAAPEESPQIMGSRRIAWIRQLNGIQHPDLGEDPRGNPPDYRASRSPKIRGFLESCRPHSTGCAVAFDASDDVFDEWIAAEGWLLTRYRALIAHTDWGESVEFSLETPLLPYASVLDGQKLLLLKARKLTQQGDYPAARELLQSDVVFWRHVLESTDMLITKMVATVAVTRNLEWGNLIARQLEPADVPKIVPDNWRTAISDSERSMQRCLIGEWRFASAFTRAMPVSAVYGDDAFGKKVAAFLLEPLLQRQDLMNAYAELYLQITERLNVPYDQYATATTAIDHLAQQVTAEALPPKSLYNLAGKLLLSLGAPEFGSYARRVADLEGVRRAVLASATLRETNVKALDVAASLASSSLRNPYDHQPLIWDAKENSIVFQGLEVGERGRHSIDYAVR